MINADVCLVLEGTYPYVTGGVASWTHDLIQSQPQIKFHIVSIIPNNFETKIVYDLPNNVTGVTNIFLNKFPEKNLKFASSGKRDYFKNIEAEINRLFLNANYSDLKSITKKVQSFKNYLNEEVLLNSEESWQLLTKLYNNWSPSNSFLDFFWSIRTLLGNLYSVLLPELPQAKVYHALCTGYAGILIARAKHENSAKAIITEHGIYTNERRIEINSAEWLNEKNERSLRITRSKRELRDLWLGTFSSYSRICYEAADKIITLYKGNQVEQLADGADVKKMQIIPNGVDTDYYKPLAKEKNQKPTIALVGRVVAIKDIKTFIRSVSIIKQSIPDIEALIIGPVDEDRKYYEECLDMLEYMALESNIRFTGKVNINDYYPKIDVLVLTSISEAQPLTILEAGACGIPVVATDVGSCRELVMGREDEAPFLGEGGIITALSNPQATSEAIIKILIDQNQRNAFGKNLRERVLKYYNKNDQKIAYKKLYSELLGK